MALYTDTSKAIMRASSRPLLVRVKPYPEKPLESNLKALRGVSEGIIESKKELTHD